MFIAFYSFVWATLILTIVLYFLLSAQFVKTNSTTTGATFGIIVLYFLPTILMVLCYVLIYNQGEKLMIKSRISTSDNYIRPNLQSEKLTKCINIVYYSVLGMFIIVQGLMMFLAIFKWIELTAFFIEITGFTIGIILIVNGYLIFQYCKLAGAPYKNQKFYRNVRWIGIVGGYWSVAFCLKFLGVLLG